MTDKDKLNRLEKRYDEIHKNLDNATKNGDYKAALNLHRKWKKNVARQHRAIKDGDWDMDNDNPAEGY